MIPNAQPYVALIRSLIEPGMIHRQPVIAWNDDGLPLIIDPNADVDGFTPVPAPYVGGFIEVIPFVLTTSSDLTFEV